jgi:hypothetical protein
MWQRDGWMGIERKGFRFEETRTRMVMFGKGKHLISLGSG